MLFTCGFVGTESFCIVILAGVAFQPEFAEPITNLSVAVGRDATFQCMVLHLGGYRVCYLFLFCRMMLRPCSQVQIIEKSYAFAEI
jgi:hypothetical protein